MVIEARDMPEERRRNDAGGTGEVVYIHIAGKKQLPANARLLSQFSLEKGCSVGKHVHDGEANIYYCVAGEGELNDNGTQVTMRAGDASICRGGAYHAIRNERDETLRVVAMVIAE